ncbi:MAG TPA: hypothetical protein VFE79_06350 [Paraburkholderia sp.]|jgi:hypothetical protein|nr:hypothetical protein [Paraburkholderia sp.]
MKLVRHLLVAAALSAGLVTCAQAHVFVGVGFSAPAFPVYAPPVYYAPPPAYYAPPPMVAAPLVSAPVVIGYYGRPHYYGGAYGYGGYAYWRH